MEFIDKSIDNLIEVIKYFVDVGLNILKYSSWQIVFLIIAMKYKQQIFVLLSSVTKISYAGFNVEFKEALKKLDRTQKPEIKSKIDEGDEQLAEMRPDLAVLNSFRTLELSLKSLYDTAEKLGKINNDAKRFKSGSQMWRELEKSHIVSSKYSKSFNILSHMRNEVTHGVANILYEDAIEYIQQVANMNQYLIDLNNQLNNQ